MRQVVDVLKTARMLIASPERWTKGSYARNAANRSVPPLDAEACKFCSVGAVKRAALEFGVQPYYAEEILCDLTWKDDRQTLVTFNDRYRTKHEDVLALFDRAIALAEQEENCVPQSE